MDCGGKGGAQSPLPEFSTKTFLHPTDNSKKTATMYVFSKELRWEMEWTLAHPLQDVEDIVELADSMYGAEAEGIVKRDRNVFRKNVTLASTYQLFDKGREFLAVCRKVENRGEVVTDELMGFCWFDRGGYTTYSNEEISNAKFHHVRLDLPVRTRVRMVNEMIDQHILWAHTWGIPVVCSTSVRVDHGAFMRIHEKRGFKVTGSYAWIRTEDGLKWMK